MTSASDPQTGQFAESIRSGPSWWRLRRTTAAGHSNAGRVEGGQLSACHRGLRGDRLDAEVRNAREFAGIPCQEHGFARQIVVVSTSNAGPAAITGGSPGTGEGSLTVGAASTPGYERVLRDLQYGLGVGPLYRPFDGIQSAYFTARGPTADGIDPELTANGFATFAQGATGGLSVVSGTSFSAPTAARAAALMRDVFPYQKAGRIRNALYFSANPPSSPMARAGTACAILWWNGGSDGGLSYLPCAIQSATRSPIMMEVALVLALITSGIIEASATRSPSRPRTPPNWSTTAMGSLSGPILHVPETWWEVPALRMSQASRASSDANSVSVGVTRSITMSLKAGWSASLTQSLMALRMRSRSNGSV